MRSIKKIVAFPFLILIRFYQYVLSPWLGVSKCRLHQAVRITLRKPLKNMVPLRAFTLALKGLAGAGQVVAMVMILCPKASSICKKNPESFHFRDQYFFF
ncbi:MAG: hypothetical protein RL064_1400 [Bacteroidota bacterium]